MVPILMQNLPARKISEFLIFQAGSARFTHSLFYLGGVKAGYYKRPLHKELS